MTNISVQTSKGTEGKALHKPDVCEAKYAKQYVTSKSVQIQKGTEGKHYTNPAFERRSTQSYKQLLNQICKFERKNREEAGEGKSYRKNRGKRVRDKENYEEIKTDEQVEPREQAIKRLKRLTNAKEILPVRVLD